MQRYERLGMRLPETGVLPDSQQRFILNGSQRLACEEKQCLVQVLDWLGLALHLLERLWHVVKFGDPEVLLSQSLDVSRIIKHCLPHVFVQKGYYVIGWRFLCKQTLQFS